MASESPRCLYCLKSDGGFTSEEHPIPESLGNREITLPPGVVCDRCNNGVLAQLDEHLLDFFPIKMRRAQVGVPSKSGKIPEVGFSGGGQLQQVEGIPALVGDFGPKAWTEEYRSKSDPRFTIGLATLSGGRKLTERYAGELLRALLKMAFGCAWVEQGETLLDDRFNGLRETIMGTAPITGYLFVAGEVDQRDTGVNLTFTAYGGGQIMAMRVLAKFYGLRMVADSGPVRAPGGLADLGTIVELPLSP